MSEAFGKLTLSHKIQEFHVKASARTLFKSLYFREFMGGKSNEIRMGLKNKYNLISFKDHEKFVTINFRDFNFMAEKIFFIIENKKQEKEIGFFLSTLIQNFFFYFSNTKKKLLEQKELGNLLKL